MVSKELKERFDAKYRKGSGCWEWTASIAGKGYGQIKIPQTRRQVYAHRLAWEINFGKIPRGKLVCHECDNPKCVNPNHLFLGTHKSNLQDMANKDRHLRGERNAQAKLAESQALEIHRLSGTLSSKELSKKFGVHIGTVHKILRGDSWTHIYLKLRHKK